MIVITSAITIRTIAAGISFLTRAIGLNAVRVGTGVAVAICWDWPGADGAGILKLTNFLERLTGAAVGAGVAVGLRPVMTLIRFVGALVGLGVAVAVGMGRFTAGRLQPGSPKIVVRRPQTFGMLSSV